MGVIFTSAHRRVVYHIVAYNSIHTADTDTICPLLECIGAAGPDVVVLDCLIGTLEGPFGDVQARPASRVE